MTEKEKKDSKTEISFERVRSHSKIASTLTWIGLAVGILYYRNEELDSIKSLSFIVLGLFGSRTFISIISFKIKKLIFSAVPFSKLGLRIFSPLLRRIPVNEKAAKVVNYFSYLLVILDVVLVYLFFDYFYKLFY